MNFSENDLKYLEPQVNNTLTTSRCTTNTIIIIVFVVIVLIGCLFYYVFNSGKKTEKMNVVTNRTKNKNKKCTNKKCNINTNKKCSKGCYEVGLILFGLKDSDNETNTDFGENEKKNKRKLLKYEAYRKMSDGMKYGFIKYALASYCVDVGHADCLRKIHKNLDVHWHADLADCAIEKDDLECLKVIIEEMGDVKIDVKNIGDNCREYVQNLDHKKLLKNKVSSAETK